MITSGLETNKRHFKTLYKGIFHEDVNYQHHLFVNNSSNYYFTNYSTNNRSVSNDQLNSKPNYFVNK